MRRKGYNEKTEKGAQESLFYNNNSEKKPYTQLIAILMFITLFFVGIGLGGKISQHVFGIEDGITEISAAETNPEKQTDADEGISGIEKLTTDGNQALVIKTEEENEKTDAEAVETIPEENATEQAESENDKSVLDEEAADGIVYRTRAGSKYHKKTCRYVQENGIKLTREEAEQLGLGPCSVCNP